MAVEAVVLNHPRGKVRLTKKELHALAGWPKLNPKGGGTKRRKKGMKKNKSGVPKSARGKAYRKVVKKYGVIEGAKKWRSMKRKPKFAANIITGNRKPKRPAKKKKSVKRNYGTKSGFRKAAKKKGLTVKKYAKRIGRKGGKARWGLNKPAKRNYGVRRNKAGLASFKKSFKELLTLDTLKDGLQVAGGGMLSVAVPNVVLGLKALEGKVPEVLTKGWGKYLVNLVAVGLTSGTASFFGQTKLAKNFLLGGVAATLNSVILDQVHVQAKKNPSGVAAKVAAAVAPGGTMGILTQDVEQAVEQAVEAELQRQGLSDYLVPEEAANPALKDYLVPAEVVSPTMADYLTPAEAVNPALGIVTDADAVMAF